MAGDVRRSPVVPAQCQKGQGWRAARVMPNGGSCPCQMQTRAPRGALAGGFVSWAGAGPGLSGCPSERGFSRGITSPCRGRDPWFR
jgi:hypothetical protein